MTALQRLLRRAGVVIAAAGIVMLLYVGAVLVEARTYRAVFRPSDVVAAGVAVPASPRSSAFVEGEPLGELRIDRLGMRALISQGESTAVLRKGVGHLKDTAWFGEGGNVVLAGHRDTVFRGLRDIVVGDLIDVTTGDGEARYEVQSTVIVAPDTLNVLESGDGSTLTLITCYPFTFFGAAPERFIVKARERR
jgi:sortase A